jgi:hypothetical protein
MIDDIFQKKFKILLYHNRRRFFEIIQKKSKMSPYVPDWDEFFMDNPPDVKSLLTEFYAYGTKSFTLKKKH